VAAAVAAGSASSSPMPVAEAAVGGVEQVVVAVAAGLATLPLAPVSSLVVVRGGEEVPATVALGFAASPLSPDLQSAVVEGGGAARG